MISFQTNADGINKRVLRLFIMRQNCKVLPRFKINKTLVITRLTFLFYERLLQRRFLYVLLSEIGYRWV